MATQIPARRLGGSPLEVTVIGFGAWAIGGSGWGQVEDEESVVAIQRSIDLGVNFIDTAPIYGMGHSEEVVGKALAGRRDKVVLATKCGYVWDDAGNARRDLTPASICREVAASLKRLRTDVIDLYQVHWPDPDTPIAETFTTLAKLREEGLVREIGVCNFTLEQLQEARKHAPLISFQPGYNLIDRGIEQEIVPWCQRSGVGITAYAPMARGLLTGKFNQDSSFADDDVRARDPRFQGERFEKLLAVLDVLKGEAKKLGKTPGQVAIAWVIQRPGLTLAICGAKTAGQVEENVRGAGWELPPAVADKLTAAFEPHAEFIIRS
jgi:aryl-alcohol dehydrogenase-like predicted oxidoreductase